MSLPTNTGEEKTNNKRSSKSTTAGNDDEFTPKKPKTFSAGNGLDYLDVETYEQLLQDPYHYLSREVTMKSSPSSKFYIYGNPNHSHRH